MNKQSKQIKKLTKRIKQLEREFNDNLDVVYENISTYDKHLEDKLRKDLATIQSTVATLKGQGKANAYNIGSLSEDLVDLIDKTNRLEQSFSDRLKTVNSAVQSSIQSVVDKLKNTNDRIDSTDKWINESINKANYWVGSFKEYRDSGLFSKL